MVRIKTAASAKTMATLINLFIREPRFAIRFTLSIIAAAGVRVCLSRARKDAGTPLVAVAKVHRMQP